MSQHGFAQIHVNELDPRAGEQRLNRFQWIGSHNSFQRSNGIPGGLWTIGEQTDIFGMRHFEIDVGWESDLPSYYADATGDFIVKHFCQDNFGAQVIDQMLTQFVQSDAIMGENHSFIYVNFDMKLDTTGTAWDCFEDLPSDWSTKLRERLESFIPQDRIYTAYEFVNIDNSRWPSQQELIRRGKSIAFGTFEGTNCDDTTCFFFGHGTGSENAVEIRSGDATDQYFLFDQFISTFYPAGNVCFTNIPFQTAVENGFTFPTTYCVNSEGSISQPSIHPPNPLFVKTVDFPGTNLGTRVRPYGGSLGLNMALSRIKFHEAFQGQSRIEMIFDPGLYEIDPLNTAPPGGKEIVEAVELKSSGGLVEITK